MNATGYFVSEDELYGRNSHRRMYQLAIGKTVASMTRNAFHAVNNALYFRIRARGTRRQMLV